MDTSLPSPADAANVKKWEPVGAIARRVLGVLVEKAKTVPDSYPMTLTGLVTGSNQKNNRDPQSTYTPEQIEEALEKLHHLGAVSIVQGNGRVTKYRHLLYEWLGVEKLELAVMAELLLRGMQTVGELRGRAARMEPMADLAALQPVLESLVRKGLVLSLTSAGRGQVVTHALFKDHELAEQRLRVGSMAAGAPPSDESTSVAPTLAASAEGKSPWPGGKPVPLAMTASSAAPSSAGKVTLDMFNELQLEMSELRAEMARIRQDLRELKGLM